MTFEFWSQASAFSRTLFCSILRIVCSTLSQPSPPSCRESFFFLPVAPGARRPKLNHAGDSFFFFFLYLKKATERVVNASFISWVVSHSKQWEWFRDHCLYQALCCCRWTCSNGWFFGYCECDFYFKQYKWFVPRFVLESDCCLFFGDCIKKNSNLLQASSGMVGRISRVASGIFEDYFAFSDFIYDESLYYLAGYDGKSPLCYNSGILISETIYVELRLHVRFKSRYIVLFIKWIIDIFK